MQEDLLRDSLQTFDNASELNQTHLERKPETSFQLNESHSRSQLSWHVERGCKKISAKKFDEICKQMMAQVCLLLIYYFATTLASYNTPTQDTTPESSEWFSPFPR